MCTSELGLCTSNQAVNKPHGHSVLMTQFGEVSLEDFDITLAFENLN